MIILTVCEKTIEDCIKKIEENIDYIDGYEIRADFLDHNNLNLAYKILEKFNLISILTYRKKCDGGNFIGDDKNREIFFMQNSDKGWSYFDVEFNSNFNLKYCKPKIIKSIHNFRKVPNNMEKFIYKIARQGAIPKIAVMPRTGKELLKFYKISEKTKAIKKIVLCMGRLGTSTRILLNKSHSLWTYSSSPTLEKIGQLTPKELVEVYNIKKLNHETKVYGIVGNPLTKSKSPLKHNNYFKERGLNNIFVPFEIENYKTFLVLAKFLKIDGFCVTIPFKEEAAKRSKYKSGDVKNCGSANTIVNNGKYFMAFNSDIDGFLNPLKKIEPNLHDKKVLVIGAGGAAKAVIYGLKKSGAKIVVLNRTYKRAKKMAEKFDIQCDKLENISTYKNFDIVVQTTAAGMTDFENINPCKNYNWTGQEIAYDIVYKPKHTKFILDAEKKGGTIIYGEQMFESQAEIQFRYFYLQ